MKDACYVFYAGLLYSQFSTLNGFLLFKNQCGAEIYNGAYVYSRRYAHVPTENNWYRMDGSPVFIEDVPKELRLLLLLLT